MPLVRAESFIASEKVYDKLFLFFDVLFLANRLIEHWSKNYFWKQIKFFRFHFRRFDSERSSKLIRQMKTEVWWLRVPTVF